MLRIDVLEFPLLFTKQMEGKAHFFWILHHAMYIMQQQQFVNRRMVALITCYIFIGEEIRIFKIVTDFTKKSLLEPHDAFFFKALKPREDTLFAIFRRYKV